MERGNTNEKLLKRANELAQIEWKKYEIQLYSKAYEEAKAKRALRTLRQTPSDPIRYTTMSPSEEIWDLSRRTGGKLRI